MNLGWSLVQGYNSPFVQVQSGATVGLLLGLNLNQKIRLSQTVGPWNSEIYIFSFSISFISEQMKIEKNELWKRYEMVFKILWKFLYNSFEQGFWNWWNQEWMMLEEDYN